MVIPSNVVGYARISSADRSEDGQVDALRRAGACRIVVEKASGVAERPLLDELIAGLGFGDALAVTEVSRLGRSVHAGWVRSIPEQARLDSYSGGIAAFLLLPAGIVSRRLSGTRR